MSLEEHIKELRSRADALEAILQAGPPPAGTIVWAYRSDNLKKLAISCGELDEEGRLLCSSSIEKKDVGDRKLDLNQWTGTEIGKYSKWELVPSLNICTPPPEPAPKPELTAPANELQL